MSGTAAFRKFEQRADPVKHLALQKPITHA
jgi:hypothetical protein